MEQHQQHQPPLYQEGEVMKAVRPGPADSPPPNCAICLGTCTNKCFTDCCMHQFCFNCLLEWSKIKAECPLCKQPFKSIIYNIKSNVEYEEHIITNPEREVQGEDLLLDEDVHTEYLFLPNGPRPQRHFQFRTTLTLEPGGEFAIQQLLLSHRMNSLFSFPRIPQQTIRFRRDVYQNNWWVEAPPDITGRYRECTPNFFRENPAQTHRIIPWLNRELTALMSDYTEIYGLQERIMEMLCQYPIQSTSFRTRLTTFFAARTDHFIHEFYNFVRSPFDMIGYDRHISYSYARPTMVFSQSVSDDDSDVRVVDSPNDCVYVPPRTPEVIVINSDSESDDVIISTPPPPAPPTIVDLVDTDSDHDFVSIDTPQIIGENDRPEESSSRSPQLPIKIRLKLNRNNAEICKTFKQNKVKPNRQRYDSDSESDQPKSESDYSTAHISPTDCTSSTMNGDETDSSSSVGEDYKPLLLKVKLKGSRKRRNESKSFASRKIRTRKLSTEERSTKTKKKSKRAKQKKSKRKDSDGGCYKSKRFKRIKRERNSSLDSAQDSTSSDSDENVGRKRKVPSCNVKQELSHANNDISQDTGELQVHNGTGSSHEETPETTTEELDVAGPSTRTPSLRSVIVKGNNMWFCRPDLDASSSDTNTD
ncbi:Topoisomerase I-interacting protein [Carabus blaptoides fortunei]